MYMCVRLPRSDPRLRVCGTRRSHHTHIYTRTHATHQAVHGVPAGCQRFPPAPARPQQHPAHRLHQGASVHPMPHSKRTYSQMKCVEHPPTTHQQPKTETRVPGGGRRAALLPPRHDEVRADARERRGAQRRARSQAGDGQGHDHGPGPLCMVYMLMWADRICARMWRVYG